MPWVVHEVLGKTSIAEAQEGEVLFNERSSGPRVGERHDNSGNWGWWVKRAHGGISMLSGSPSPVPRPASIIHHDRPGDPDWTNDRFWKILVIWKD